MKRLWFNIKQVYYDVEWFVFDHTHPYVIYVCDAFLDRENRRHVVRQFMSMLRTNWKKADKLEDAVFGKNDGRILRFRTKRQAAKVLGELYKRFPEAEAGVGVIVEWRCR